MKYRNVYVEPETGKEYYGFLRFTDYEYAVKIGRLANNYVETVTCPGD